jgi:non-lysosomal glucosylceramidase
MTGTGALTQWQIQGQGNHLGASPQSLFGLRLSSLEPPFSYRRVLQAPPLPPHAEPAPLVNDHVQYVGPDPLADARWPRVRGTVLRAAYPIAEVTFEDDWPVDVVLEAVTPFVPLDEEASALPVALFTLSVTNRFTHDIHGWWLATLQNTVGWDGVTLIRGNRCAVLGGNVNTAAELSGGTAVLMTNPATQADAPGAGSMALWTPGPAVVQPEVDDVDTAFAFVDGLKLLSPVVLEDWSDDAVRRATAAVRPVVTRPDRPSAAGSTWAGALAVPLHVRPGETVSRRVAFAWHFPNRLADFDRFGDSDRAGARAPWIGNHYATRFADAADVVAAVADQGDDLMARTRRWVDALQSSSLPPVVVDVLAAQPSLIRSPTTFQSADGHFLGFEGVLGESTLNWNGNAGGSCPLNCTHVWNYEQAVSRLFPRLERTMREVDWEVLQAPEGYLPHRVLLPLDGPQLHGRPIGGPTRPALDGMLGTVLKTYREVRQGAGVPWLARYLPHARALMDYVTRTWDPDDTGVLTGDQPVTHDISLTGANMFIGALWLASLRAMQEMVTLVDGAGAEAARLGDRFASASKAYDSLLWNGEFYAQPESGSSAAYDYGAGCLSDQLFGQWWAHQLDLGHLLPVEHVRLALAAVVRHNLRAGFRGFEHGYRVFADADDTGLLVCTWPHGGRPNVPIRYADEVWTGVEYQVAAHCFYEGLTDEGLRVLEGLRGRYDGTRRNPYNEIECGDHYARAMAGWSVLEPFTGSGYDAVSGRLTLGRDVARYPLMAVTGWGVVDVEADRITLTCREGTIAVRELVARDGTVDSLLLDGSSAVLPLVVPTDGVLGVGLSGRPAG